MIRFILASLLLAPALALAQQPPTDPGTIALGQMVIEAARREADIRAQLIAAQAHIAELEKPKPAAPAPTPDLPK